MVGTLGETRQRADGQVTRAGGRKRRLCFFSLFFRRHFAEHAMCTGARRQHITQCHDTRWRNVGELSKGQMSGLLRPSDSSLPRNTRRTGVLQLQHSHHGHAKMVQQPIAPTPSRPSRACWLTPGRRHGELRACVGRRRARQTERLLVSKAGYPTQRSPRVRSVASCERLVHPALRSRSLPA
jgi:hypothetical protein